MKRLRLFNLISGFGLTGLLVVAAGSSALAASGPFSCSSNFYQVISGQLKVLDPTTGAYTSIGSQQADNYNAIGYDVLDNYLYGIKTNVTDGIGAVGDLLRIANDGTVTDLGPISGMPVSGYNNGSFDLNGNLYIRAGNSSFYKVNVATVSATTVTTTGANIISSADNVVIGNSLYFLSGSTLSVVNLSTDVVTNATVTGPSGWLSAGNSFGAGWTDAAGELFFSNNNSGSLYQITGFTTASPTAAFDVAGMVTTNNDGASCPLAVQNPFQAPVITSPSFTSPTNNINRQISGSLLNGDIGNGLTVTGNTNPAHGNVVVNADGTFVYTPSAAFNGVDSFNYTVTDAFGRATTATVNLSVEKAAASGVMVPDTGYGVSTNLVLPLLLMTCGSLSLLAGWYFKRALD